MKNSKLKNASFFDKGKSLLLVLILLFITKQGQCQKPTIARNENLGFASSSMISANGYGGMYSPMVYYKKDRRSYFIGPIIQNQKLNFSGVQFNYDYTIAGEDAPGNEADNKNLELFCFVTAAYHYNAMLGKRALWEEHMANSEYEGQVCNLRFKSVEVYGGVGLKIKLFKNFKWVNCLGLGGYSSFNFPGHLYYNANSLGLILKTGISFDFKK